MKNEQACRKCSKELNIGPFIVYTDDDTSVCLQCYRGNWCDIPWDISTDIAIGW